MASVQEVVNATWEIGKSAEELSQISAMAGQGLGASAREISALVQGSRTGMDAVMALNVASRSVGQAAASILGLKRSCERFVSNITK